MARPKIKKEEKRVKLGITIDPELNAKVEAISTNKSKFIDQLIRSYFDSTEKV